MRSPFPSGIPQRLSLALLPCLLALPSSALAQATLDVRPLYPTAGAAGVPTNASLRIEFRGALFVETERPLALALVVANDAGAVSSPPAIAGTAFRLEQGRKRYRATPAGEMSSSEADGFDLQTEPLELLPGTRYRVQSSVAACEEGDADLICLQTAYDVIAEFQTGAGPDEVPPAAERIGEPVVDAACTVRIRVQGEDDHTPAELIRYAQQGDSLIDLGLGPEVLVQGRSRDVTGADVTTERVVPIDQSGNVGAPFEVEVPTCFNPLAGYGSDIAPADDAAPSDVRVVGDRAEGCSLGVPRGAGRLWAVPTTLALSVLAWRRRRCPAK